MDLRMLLKPFLFAAVLAGAGPARAVDLQTLLERSPFAPAGADAAGVVEAPQGTLEFRGVVTDDEGTAFGIFDLATNKGRWLRAGDSDGPVRLKGFDEANGVLEIERNGQPLRLTLKRSVIQAGTPASAMVAAAGPVASRRPFGAQASAAAANAQRLKALAEAVRARRALRNAHAARLRSAAQPAPLRAPAGS